MVLDRPIHSAAVRSCVGWNAADLLDTVGRVLAHKLAELIEFDRVIGDEVRIDGVVLYQQVAQAVQQRHVGSRPELQVKVSSSRDRQRAARIDHDHLRPKRPGFGRQNPHPQNGALFGGVVTHEHDALSVIEVLVRTGRAVRAERFHQRRCRGRGAEPCIRVDGGDA